jgi:hypothetical protein
MGKKIFLNQVFLSSKNDIGSFRLLQEEITYFLSTSLKENISNGPLLFFFLVQIG